MINLFKKLFIFYYYSPLGKKECRSRFSNECKHALIAAGSFPGYSKMSLRDSIEPAQNGVTRVDVSSGLATFTYLFTLEAHNSSTVLRCEHSPLSMFSLGSAVAIVICIVVTIVSMAIQMTPISIAGIIFSGFFGLIIACILFGTPAGLAYYFTRQRVTKTLYYLLLAVPVTDKKYRDEFESLFRVSRERKT